MAELRGDVPRLIVFSDTARAPPARMVRMFARLAERAKPRTVLFILRDYTLSLPARWTLGQELGALTRRTEQLFGIADRADLARALGCPAFHLPESGLRADDARRYLGPDVFLSRGSHDPSCAPAPELDAILLSPIFESRKGRPALGIAALGIAARALSAGPSLFALGAVDAHNANECLSAGAAGVAVIGAALWPDPDLLLGALGILCG